MNNKNEWVPQWAKKAVWYQIFPERFRNGNPAVNPSLKDTEGAWPHDMHSPWEIHPWTSDWYELQPYEKQNNKSIGFNLVRRRYGGDLQGIIDKLDYLQDLGINAIYLNPVFESPSHHKYDGTIYHHIDRTLGPDPQGDQVLIEKENPADPLSWKWTAADMLALELIRKVHDRKMHIIFDGVFNHVSINNPFFKDVVKNQQASPFRDWFSVNSWDDPVKGTVFSYNGWWGVAELPEWRQDKNGIVDGPRQYISEITKRWMAPDGIVENGIDGWRLDVAFCVKHPFWKDWRKLVKSINPQAYLTAEVIEPVEDLKPYLQGDEFDAVMNYNVGFACADYFINRKKRIKTSEFDKYIQNLRDAFDPQVAYVQQNLMDSHDSNRVASHIVNPDGIPYRDWGKYHSYSKTADNPDYNPQKPNKDEYQINKLIFLFMATYIGAPMIYYGGEAGMWGANDPCCRKPMIWDDLPHQPEIYLADGSKKDVPDDVSVNKDLFNTYRKLIHIRHKYNALTLGDFKTILTDDKNRIYAFRRKYLDQTILVILNNKNEEQPVTVQIDGQSAINILRDNHKIVITESKLHVKIQPLWGSILLIQ